MIEEFDKEIDFLLRQTARGKVVSAENQKSEIQNPSSVHLDADEISALAENALPEIIRRSYVLHLADCERCRTSLSSLIALNSDAESEIIHAENFLAAEVYAPPMPWYRRLFAVPNLAYAMGALVLIFAGIGVFTVLQNNNSADSAISQISEKQIGGKGASSDGDTATQEVYRSPMSSNTSAMSNMAAANSTANASNSALSVAPALSANSNAMTARRATESNSDDSRKDDKSLRQPNNPVETADSATAAAPPPPAKPGESNFEPDSQRERQPPNPAPNAGGQNQTAQNQTQIMPDTRNVQRAPLPVAKEEDRENKSDAAKLVAKKKTVETTSVGGKTFNRGDNVWIDSTYRGQKTTNVSRGSKEYKKLDSGLRGVVENLGGTVIVVWKEKVYRIQ